MDHLQNELTIPLQPGEYWYGVRANDGLHMPLSVRSDYEADIDPNQDCNQCNPLLISSKGRYIWCESGFTVRCREGLLSLRSGKRAADNKRGLGSLRGGVSGCQPPLFSPKGTAAAGGFFPRSAVQYLDRADV